MTDIVHRNMKRKSVESPQITANQNFVNQMVNLSLMFAAVGKLFAGTGFEPGFGPHLRGFPEVHRGCRARHEFFGSGSTACSLAGHRLRYLCRARLPVRHARRVLGLGFAIDDRAGDVYAGRFLRPAGIPHAVADRARQRRFRAGGAGKQRRERRVSGRPRSCRVRGAVRYLRHHPPLRAALRRQLFADDFSDAPESCCNSASARSTR